MYPALERYFASLAGDTVGPERRTALQPLVAYVAGRLAHDQPPRLVFICTHNSRRSQFGQVWAATAAAAAGLSGLESYSGGTEVTAFNPRAVAALERAGFAAVPEGDANNPRYTVRMSDDHEPLMCFSKVYDDAANPSADFAAVMTCTDADERCPLVVGAAARISLPYVDPKAQDDTPDEARAYDARCRQIASEMRYVAEAVARELGRG